MELRAVRPITPGEEITISYNNELVDWEERRKPLKENFDFMCRCSACALPWRQLVNSNRNRHCIETVGWAALLLWRHWIDANMGAARNAVIDLHMSVLKIIDEENLDRYRGKHIRWIAAAYAALGDAENFKKWAEEMLQSPTSDRDGFGFVDSDLWRKWMQKPKSFPTWGIYNRR